MRPTIWLVGDYVDSTTRQQQATTAGCIATVDFHFNSNGSTAQGGEVWYRPGDASSEVLANRILSAYGAVGLPKREVQSADAGTRAAFIRHYTCTSVLIEPLFVSNPQQADWIHNPANLSALAQAVASELENITGAGDLIGLSIGHRCKPSAPDDKGARCYHGDYEATHGTALAVAVATILNNNTPIAAPECAL